jgi:phosphopentomutase
VTADHGCDPTTPSTDHSREYVPLLVYAPGRGGGKLGTRGSFADLGATVAEHFGLPAEVGTSFLDALR